MLRILLRELLHAVDRNVLVLVAEVTHERHLWSEAGVVEDPAAVVGDRRREAGDLARGEPSDEPAPAVADDSDLAGTRGGLHRSLRILDGHVVRDLAANLASLGDVVGRVAE